MAEAVMKTCKKGRIPAKTLSIDEAAEKLADAIEKKYLKKMDNSEKKAWLEAFHKSVSSVCGSAPKAERRSHAMLSPVLSRGRA